MKKKVYRNELFPFYELSDMQCWEGEIEVSEEFIGRYNKVMEEFIKIQEELEEMYK